MANNVYEEAALTETAPECHLSNEWECHIFIKIWTMRTVCLLESLLMDMASSHENAVGNVCRLTMADSNTLGKYLQLKTLRLQKGFTAANRSSGDWNVTVIQLCFFLSLTRRERISLPWHSVELVFCGALYESVWSFSSCPSWCKLLPAPPRERWGLGAEGVRALSRQRTACRWHWEVLSNGLAPDFQPLWLTRSLACIVLSKRCWRCAHPCLEDKAAFSTVSQTRPLCTERS